MKKGLLKGLLGWIFIVCAVTLVKAQTVTSANNTSGLTTGNLYFGQTGIALNGVTLTPGTGSTINLASLTFTETNGRTIANYFPSATFKLYKSSTATYGGGTLTPVNGTFSFPTASTVMISGISGAEGTFTAASYYFLVADYTAAGATNLTSGTTTTTRFQLTNVTSNATAINPSNYNGNQLTMRSPAVSISGINGQGNGNNGITSGNLSYNQSAIVLFGTSVTVSNSQTTISSMTFNASQTVTNYFSQASFKLYKSSTNNYSTGSPALVPGATFSVSGTTITVSGMSEAYSSVTTSASQTGYYFIVADFDVNGAVPVNFRISFPNNNITYTTGGGNTSTTTTGGQIDGVNFTLSAPTINIGGLHGQGSGNNGITTPSTLVYNQTGIVFYGFSVSVTNASTTLNSINLSISNNINLSNYFGSTIKLYSCSTNNYTSGTKTLISSATVTPGNGSLNITNMNEAFTASASASQTKYYFLVADYNTYGSTPSSTTTQFQVGYNNAANYTTGGSTTSNTPASNPGSGVSFTLTAPTVTFGSINGTGSGANGITSGSLGYTQTGIVLFGYSVQVSNAPTTLSQVVLSANTTITNYFGQSSFKLYKSNTNNYTTGAPALVAGATFNINNQTLTISGMSESFTASAATGATQTNYYFIVADYNVNGSVPSSMQFSYTGNNATYTTGTSNTSLNTSGTFSGNNFTLAAPSVSINGLHGQGSANNGITNPSTLVYGQTDVAFYGFSVTNTNAPTTLNSINFNVTNSINLASYFGTTFKLYSCSTNNYATGTKTLVSATITPGSGSLNVSNINEAFTASQTKYYFLVADYTTYGNVPNTTTQFQVQYNTVNYNVGSNSTSNSLTANPGNGNTFTFQAPIVTITGNNTVGSGNNGITATSLSYGQTGIVMFGFSVNVAGASTNMSSITLNASVTNSITSYFSQASFKLYKTTTTNYTTGAPTLVSGASFNVGGSSITISGMNEAFTANVNSNTTQTNNYFVVADYNTAGSVPGTIQLQLLNGNITYATGTSTTSTTTTGGTLSGQTFNMQAPTVTFTGINTIGTGSGGNGISSTALYYGQTGIVMYGFQLTVTGSPTTISAVNLTTNNPAANFFSNFKVYSSPTSTFNVSTATLLTTTLSPANGNSAFNITGFNEAFTLGQTKYYFVMADYTAINNVLPSTMQFNYSDVTSSVTNTVKSTSNTTGQTFSMAQPILTISNYNTGVYTGNTITFGQTYNLLGFNLTYTGPTNMHELVLDVTYPSGGDNFTSGYVQSVDLVDAATGTRPSYITYVNNNGSNIAIGFNISVPQSGSTNYLLKVTFKNDGIHKPTAFNVCLTGGANAASNLCGNNSNCIFVNNYSVTSTGASCSQSFVNANIYDWTGDGGNSNWNNPNNWLKDGASTTSAPVNSTDVVRIGYVKYTGSPSPRLSSSSVGIGVLEIGKFGSNTTTATAVTLDLNGKDLTVSNGLTIDANATLNLDNTTTTTSSLNVSGASTMASTASISFNSTNPIKVNKTGGTFVLQSDVNGTASIGAIPSSSSFTGTYIVQRYFKATRTWRLLSSPVNNSNTIPMTGGTFDFVSLKTNLLVTGTGGSNNGFSQPNGYTANGASVLFYNTSTSNFTALSGISTAITRSVGSGFYFYYRGDNFTNLTNKVIRSASTGNFATPEAAIGLQTGYLNQQGLTLTLSNAGAGYNLVGNPYPSTITLPSGSSTPIYVGTTNFVYTYNPGGTSVSAQPSAVNIASGQGFFVKSNAGTSSITLSESLKTSSQVTGSNLLMSTPKRNDLAVLGFESVPNTIAVSATNPAAPALIGLKMVQDSANYDIAYLRYHNDYKATYDEMEDADDLNANGQTVFFGAMTGDNKQVAIASQPMNKTKTAVYLSVNDNTSGTYSIQRTDISGVPDYYDIWLKDNFKKDSLDLRSNDTYNFNLDKNNAATYGNARFQVVLSRKVLPPYQLVSFTGKKVNSSDELKWNTANEYNYTAFEVQRSFDGVNFTSIGALQSSGKGNYNYTDQSFTSTVYYRLKQLDVDGKVSYSSIVIISPGDVFSIYPNPAAGFLKFDLTHQQPVKGRVIMHIYNSTGVMVINNTFSSTTGEQNVAALTQGSYVVELIDSDTQSKIVSGKFIKL